MPELISSTTSQITFLELWDSVIIRRDVVVVVSGSPAIAIPVTDRQLIIDGLVAASRFDTIEMGGRTSIRIGQTGQVISGGEQPGNAAISTYARTDAEGDSQITNAGEILANVGIGVFLGTNDNHLFNSGLISGGSGVLMGGLSGTGNTLFNSGAITATHDTVGPAADERFGHGVLVEGDRAEIVNHGSISAQGLGGVGVRVGVIGLDESHGNGSRIENHGSITSARNWGVDLSLMGAGATARIENFGTISGRIGGILGNDAADVVVNRGLVRGDIDLGAGADLFDGIGGRVEGAIRGGASDDVYRLSDPVAQIVETADQGQDRIEATISFDLAEAPHVEDLTLLGSAAISGTGTVGNNVLTGNRAANGLVGLTGNDRMLGQGGNDILDGGTGHDSLFGGTGDDTLRARQGNDRISGEFGDDRLTGGDGNDQIDGGYGDDTLMGNAGQDTMTGGADADVFEFAKVTDSGPSPGQRDIITDFVAGVDVIDLSDMDANALAGGNQAFVWIGTAGFTLVAGQVRVAATGTNRLLEGDVTGDGIADFRIDLIAPPGGIDAGDMIL